MANTRRLSDASLVRRSQQGDRRAFGALVGRYDWRLRGLAHALLLDPVAMDEALSLAYLRAWRDVVRLTAKEDVGAWLYRATYNACIDRLRRDGPSPAGPAGAPGAERRRGTRTGLAALTPADRVALVLVDREEFSPEAAARILGLTPATLIDRVEAARAEVAAHLPAPRPAPPPEPETEPPVAEAPKAEAKPKPEAPAKAPAKAAAKPPAQAPKAERPVAAEPPAGVPSAAAAPPAEAEAEVDATGGNGNGADGDGHEPDAEPGAEGEAEGPADTEVPAGVGGNGRPAARRGRRARQRANRRPPDGTA